MTALPNIAEPLRTYGQPVRRSSARLRLVEPAPRTVIFAAPELSLAHEAARRVLNIIAASVGLVLAAPIMLVVAIAVRVTSPGPIIYSQVRVGRDRRRRAKGLGYPRRANDLGGSPFRIYKFRTMRVDAEKGSGAVWASQNDPRVTPIGRVLRKYRLDELPQLLNVLLGDMNIVGPRPERPAIFQQLRGAITDYEYRQLARPGITGLAQVSQDYDSNVEDVKRKVQFDLTYIRRQGLFEDVRIMAKTVPVVLFGRGAR
jgi:lipopolysaccharide/colanic/teichoic acid biosynthesis glycosyltransferase